MNADYILLYLSKPEQPLSSLGELLEKMEEYLVLKQLGKTDVIPLYEFDSRSLQSHFKRKWAQTHIKYLGVLISNNLDDIFKINPGPAALENREVDLKQRQMIPISIFGRLNVLKMNVSLLSDALYSGQ